MSTWTYIRGVVAVSPMGDTNPQMEYILRTVLEHLPIVSGSERDMEVYVNRCYRKDCSSSTDEFGMDTDKGTNWEGQRIGCNGMFDTQSNYLLTVRGNLRDREFKETYRSFQNWLCRLAKRILVEDVVVNIYGYYDSAMIVDHTKKYFDMFELPSWSSDNGLPTWCEYLLWTHAKTNPDLPALLVYKYYNDDDNDKLVENGLLRKQVRSKKDRVIENNDKIVMERLLKEYKIEADKKDCDLKKLQQIQNSLDQIKEREGD